jgi:hypothetical protein
MKTIDVAGSWKITRGFVKNEADRAKLVEAAGIPMRDIRTGEVPTMRKGEALAVLSVGDLGEDRFEIAERVAVIRAAGATVIEFPALRVAGDGVQMLNDALSRKHGAARKMTPELASAMAKARETAKRKGRMPKAQAIKIWRASRYKSFVDALAHMPGWNKMSAYNELGPRNTGAGRPRKS